MKAVIFVSGLGTSISEEIDLKPKPMIPIGGMPHFLAHHENVLPLESMNLLFAVATRAMSSKSTLQKPRQKTLLCDQHNPF